MSIKVELWDLNASEVMKIVYDLKKGGMVQGLDFDFAFHPAKLIDYRNNILDIYDKPHATFEFYTEKLATFFILKYKHENRQT